LQLLRDADDVPALAAIAGALPRDGSGSWARPWPTVTEPGCTSCCAVRWAVATDTSTGLADGSVSKILPGESVGELSVLDEQANIGRASVRSNPAKYWSSRPTWYGS